RGDTKRTVKIETSEYHRSRNVYHHSHMLAERTLKMSVAGVVGFLKKGKSNLLLHECYGNLKYKHGDRSFWCRGYYDKRAAKKIVERYEKNCADRNNEIA
ncbi:MAG: transposase, partial [Christensenellaceae bacterium]